MKTALATEMGIYTGEFYQIETYTRLEQSSAVLSSSVRSSRRSIPHLEVTLGVEHETVRLQPFKKKKTKQHIS